MPATSARQFGLLGAVASGKSTKATGLSRAEAREFLRETPPGKRRQFARVLARKRKGRKRHRSAEQKAFGGGR